MRGRVPSGRGCCHPSSQTPNERISRIRFFTRKFLSEAGKLGKLWLEFSLLRGRMIKASKFSDDQKAFILKQETTTALRLRRSAARSG